MRRMFWLALGTITAVGHSQANQVGFARDVNESGFIIVWKSDEAFASGMQLSLAPDDPLASRYVSCTIPAGTAIAEVGGSWIGTTAIVVINGAQAGCEGVIKREEFGGSP